MKPSLHPSGDQRLKQPFHCVRLPRKASLAARAKQWLVNLCREWQAVISPRTAEGFYRASLTLAVFAVVVGILFCLGVFSPKKPFLDGYMVYKSNRTGEIKKVFNPDGKEVHLTDEQMKLLRMPETILIK